MKPVSSRCPPAPPNQELSGGIENVASSLSIATTPSMSSRSQASR